MLSVFVKLGKNIASINKGQMMEEIFSTRSLQSQIIDFNQAQMYDKGVDSDGRSLGEYSLATIYGTTKFEGKIAKGQRYDHITLKDSGGSYDSMKVETDNSGLAIKGDFPDSIKQRFPDALGLTQDSKTELLPEVNENLIEKILKKARK